MSDTFFATMWRMKYIERWALMRSSRSESLSEHSLDVAMLAHALCILGNERLGKSLNAERAALIALYHDTAEIITGDLPTPVKHGSPEMKAAYAETEKQALSRLLQKLPADLRPVYSRILDPDPAQEDPYLLRLVKAADKLSALIKCIEEETSGNREFHTAMCTTQRAVDQLSAQLPEVAIFVREFLSHYGSTLDELLM